MLAMQVARAEHSILTKLVICVVADTFDNFEGYFEKILFGEVKVEKLYGALCNVDLSTDEIKQLVALVVGNKKTPDLACSRLKNGNSFIKQIRKSLLRQ